MKRRDFIKSSVILSSSSLLLSSCYSKLSEEKQKRNVSGFIISDAHIGWKGEDQPNFEEQIKAIQVIRKKFPNVNLFFDTGDLHHGYLNENERNQARDFWLGELISPFSDALFSYIPGNHELGKGPTDEEITAAKIGSQNFRPYYSFDYCGLHFVSLPQLMDTILITQESLNWLEHDLWLNQDKTTLIFSHNSINGTTFNNGETGYRAVINTEELLEVMNRYGNVIAWFHGHNHQYEIVEKHDRLYVSNGRIGGFSPPENWGSFGQGHLGGVYFEVNDSGIEIRCFSATRNDFFENFGSHHLSRSLKKKTSFDPNSKCNYYFGHGFLTNNVKHNVENHFLSPYSLQVSSRILEENALNDNSHFQFPTELYFSQKLISRVIGYQILPKTLNIQSINEGLLLKENLNENPVIHLPTMKKKSGFLKRGSYYRCESGDAFDFQVGFIINSELENSKCSLQFFVFDKNHNEIYKSDITDKDVNDLEINFNISIPQLLEKSVEKYLRVSIELKRFPPEFVINKVKLVKNTVLEIESFLKWSDCKVPITSQLKTIDKISKRGKLSYHGSKPVSCVIKVPDVKWHVRNAHAVIDGNTIDVQSWSHKYQYNPEVILTPTSSKSIFLNKVIATMPFRITYLQRAIQVIMQEMSQNSLLVFKSKIKVKNIKGAKDVIQVGKFMYVTPELSTLEISY